jgi:hypothetical protein
MFDAAIRLPGHKARRADAWLIVGSRHEEIELPDDECFFRWAA